MEVELPAAAVPLDLAGLKLVVQKLRLQPGDLLVIRRSDAAPVSRTEAKQVREAVLTALEGEGLRPALLFVDGYELAVIHGE